MLLSIGIDVGSHNGAIAVIDEEFRILSLQKAPFRKVELSHTSANRTKPKLNKETGMYEQTYRTRTWTDPSQFKEIFEPYKNKKIIYTIENVSVRRGEGEISSFIFGHSLGCFEGLIPYLNPIEVYKPTPGVWKADLGVTSDKSTSITLAEDIFGVNLKDYLEKGKVDDIAEALLLATYGFKKYHENSEGEI